MADVKVKVGVVPDGDLQATLREIDAGLAKLKQNISGGAGGATREVEGLNRGLQTVGGTLGKLRGAAAGILGGAGLGRFGALAGIAGGPAMLAAVGGVMAQAVRMALDFERSATRAGSQLSIGADSLTSSVRAIKEASYRGIAHGYTAQAVAGAIGAYGAGSGATARQASASSAWLTMYGRAYGYTTPAELAQFGGAVGGLEPFAGGNTRRNLSQIYGAETISGNFGRRPEEFMGTLQQLITTLQMQSPGVHYSLDDALRMQVGVARSGGIFATAAGNALGTSAIMGTMQGVMGDPLAMATARRAGIPLIDIITGNVGKGGVNAKKMLMQIDSDLSPFKSGGENIPLAERLTSQYGQQPGTALYEMWKSHGGSFKDIVASNLPLGENKAKSAADQSDKSDLGQFDKAAATLNDTLTKLGEEELPHVVTALNLLNDGIGKLGGIENALKVAIGIGTAITAASAAGGILGLLKGMGNAAPAFIKGLGGVGKNAPSLLGRMIGGLASSDIVAAGLPLGTLLALNGAGIGIAAATGRSPLLNGANFNNASDAQQFGGINRLPANSGSFEDRLKNAIFGQESGDNYGIMNHKGSGAMGRYQFIPSTADASLKNSAYGRAFLQAYGSTSTAAGRKAFLMDPKAQDWAFESNYNGLMRAAEKLPGGKNQVNLARYIARGWYGGPLSMTHPETPGQYPGDPNVGEYGEQVLGRMSPGSPHTTKQKIGNVYVETKVTTTVTPAPSSGTMPSRGTRK